MAPTPVDQLHAHEGAHAQPNTGSAGNLSSSPVSHHSHMNGDHLPNGHGHDHGEDALQEKKRRYSLDLFNYTNDMWQEVRKDMERRSRNPEGQDGESATSSSESSPVESDASGRAGAAGQSAA